MITLLTGDNSFEIQRAIDEIVGNFDGTPEKIDGENLQLSNLPDVLMGISLFATKRLVIVRGLSENKSIWSTLGDWLPRISDDIHLILVEPKPDKRTVTFKALQKVAKIIEFTAWTERDVQKAEKWVMSEVKRMGLQVNTKCVQLLISRVGMDQWQLYHALEKLALIGEVTEEKIKDVIEANPIQNVFSLFEMSAVGDTKSVKKMLDVIKKNEDVFRLSSLLFIQAFQLAALSVAEKGDYPARDFVIHPFVAQKMTLLAKKIGKRKVLNIISVFAECDKDMKLSKADPWLLVERALMKIAQL